VRLKGLEQLSGQGIEIFRRLGMGVGNMADAKELSRKTVESYCERRLVKTGLRGMKKLRLLAMKHLEPEA